MCISGWMEVGSQYVYGYQRVCIDCSVRAALRCTVLTVKHLKVIHLDRAPRSSSLHGEWFARGQLAARIPLWDLNLGRLARDKMK